MRLGARFLTRGALASIGLFASAQAPLASRAKPLPWEAALMLPPWQAVAEGPQILPPVQAEVVHASNQDLKVLFAPDGSLRILDRRGVLRLKLGLPGRVARLWRDGGDAVDPGSGSLWFPKATPLAQGAGELPWGLPDLRPGLRGLLWILDDGERVLTVVHPATSQVQYIALPSVSEPELAFFPDHLELWERPSASGIRTSPRRWSLPWMVLLPQFLRLAQIPAPTRQGTAFQPFPKD